MDRFCYQALRVEGDSLRDLRRKGNSFKNFVKISGGKCCFVLRKDLFGRAGAFIERRQTFFIQRFGAYPPGGQPKNPAGGSLRPDLRERNRPYFRRPRKSVTERC